LRIFEIRFRRLVAWALDSHRMFVVAMPKPGASETTPSTIAGLGLVRVCVDHPDGTSHLILQGISRVELTGMIRRSPFTLSHIRPLRAPACDSLAVDALVAKVRDLVTERIQLGFPAGPPFPRKLKAQIKEAQLTAPEIIRCLEKMDDPDQLADRVSSAFLSRANQKQIILETVEVEPRLKHLIHFLMAEISRRQKNNPDKK
jgi:ATP-dependent Lon protease